MNVYAFPALVSLVLLCVETIYLYFNLPETRGYKSRPSSIGSDQKAQEVKVEVEVDAEDTRESGIKRESVEVRKERLRKLGRLHGLFLLFFSGVS